MIIKFRLSDLTGVLVKRSGPFVIAGLAALSAGCSADVTRFDKPPFGLTEGNGSSAGPRPNAPLSGSGTGDQSFNDTGARPAAGGYSQSASRGSARVQIAALPDVETQPDVVNRTPPVASAPSYDRAAARAEPTFGARPAASAARDVLKPVKVAEVEVQRGDTLYGLSRRFGVTVNDLMGVNGLTKPNLKPGQVLKLPTGASASSASRSNGPVTPKVATGTASASAPTSWGGSYTMVRGDSLYKIARKFGVKTGDLQRFNGIGNPRRVRPGTVLKVPGSGGGGAIKVATRTPVSSTPSTRTVRLSNPTSSTASGSRVAVINAKPSGGSGSPRVVQSVRVSPPTVSAPDKTKLRWPVRGKVISKFGRRSDGTQNDGINLEVPMGTDVKAAENGVVAYSGSELRGYGKLVLVRHDNGWVTAYAHNKDVMVKRGDKVKRGQVIAKAGKSGQVDRPQVHFELRRDAKPVDPIPYLETL